MVQNTEQGTGHSNKILVQKCLRWNYLKFHLQLNKQTELRILLPSNLLKLLSVHITFKTFLKAQIERYLQIKCNSTFEI